jgi:hypothetical protein
MREVVMRDMTRHGIQILLSYGAVPSTMERRVTVYLACASRTGFIASELNQRITSLFSQRLIEMQQADSSVPELRGLQSSRGERTSSASVGWIT